MSSVEARQVAPGEVEAATSRSEPDLPHAAARGLLRRLGLDIHDGPLQALAVITGELHLLRDELAAAERGAGASPLARAADRLVDRVCELADELRGLAVAARDGAEPAHPLAELLRDAVDLYADSFEIDLCVDVDADALTERQRLALGRIVQTALANVAQHSGATRAAVSIRPVADGTLLEIADDGCGFDVVPCLRRAAREGRLGLASMRERVRFLGGELRLESGPGGPTLLRVFLPRSGGS